MRKIKRYFLRKWLNELRASLMVVEMRGTFQLSFEDIEKFGIDDYKINENSEVWVLLSGNVISDAKNSKKLGN